MQMPTRFEPEPDPPPITVGELVAVIIGLIGIGFFVAYINPIFHAIGMGMGSIYGVVTSWF